MEKTFTVTLTSQLIFEHGSTGLQQVPLELTTSDPQLRKSLQPISEGKISPAADQFIKLHLALGLASLVKQYQLQGFDASGLLFEIGTMVTKFVSTEGWETHVEEEEVDPAKN